MGCKVTIKRNKAAILRNSYIEVPFVGYKVAIMRNKFINEKYKVRNKVAITRNTASNKKLKQKIQTRNKFTIVRHRVTLKINKVAVALCVK